MTTQANENVNLFDSLHDFGQLMRYQRVFIGNKPDARDCDYLELAVVLHNWPSQWHSRFPKGYIQLRVIRNNQQVNFDIAANSVNGREIYIFLERTGIERLRAEKEIETEKKTEIECAQYLIAEGEKLQTGGNWYGAACKYKKAINLNPSDAKAHSLLGYALWKLGNYEEAISVLTQGTSLTSDRWLLARLYDARGLAKSDLQDIDGARGHFKESLKYASRGVKPKTMVHLGILEERCAEFAMAYTCALTALRYSPEYRPALKLKERLEKSGYVKLLSSNTEGLAA